MEHLRKLKIYSLWLASQVELVVKNPLANAGDTRDAGSIPGWGRSPRSRKWQPTLVSLPGKFHGQAAGHGVAKNWTWLSMRARVRTRAHTHTHILYDTKWSSPVLGMTLCISHEGIVSGLQPLILLPLQPLTLLPTLQFSVLRLWIGTLQTKCLLCQQLTF